MAKKTTKKTINKTTDKTTPEVPDVPKRKRGRPKGVDSRSATFRLPEELLELLAEQAGDEGRTQTMLVKRALEAYLEERSGQSD